MDIKRGVVVSFDAGAYTAIVRLAGSVSVNLEAVPVARDIASGEMTAGRRVAVLFFDELNPADAVVLAVWV